MRRSAAWLLICPLLFTTAIVAGTVPDMLDSGWPVLGWLLIVGYVGVAGLLAWQLVTQRPAIVVDRRGIHCGRRRFIAWSEISSIGPVSGPKLARHLLVFPKDVWAKNLALSQQNVNDLQTFRAWLDELLAEQRRSATPEGQKWQ
ncbi:hypothetical protein [Kribbella rubisoli]|uniref:hypothetical protein n=1 Tax=Kribbella rubisoli TaxID=3075929 RepID=UPI00102C66D6|nr:hypothetical protein [Kribbella rubisoli]